MSDKTTATERLRKLLDERGVEYETYHDAALTEVDAVFWQDRNGQPCSAIGNADDIPEGMLSVQCIISPEQAVEATLGRGTCEVDVLNTGDCAGYECSEYIMHCNGCGHEFGHVLYNEDGDVWMSEPPRFCPNCGRMVECEQ